MGRKKVDHSESVCSDCGGVGVSQYYTKGKCIPCYSKTRYEFRADSPERPDHNEFLEKRRENAKKWNTENPEKYKENKHKWRLKVYGLKVDEYKNLLYEQNGVCKICKDSPKEGKRLSVDHDHNTKKVRALLCNRCNMFIGDLETIPKEIQESAKNYLLSFSPDTLP